MLLYNLYVMLCFMYKTLWIYDVTIAMTILTVGSKQVWAGFDSMVESSSEASEPSSRMTTDQMWFP